MAKFPNKTVADIYRDALALDADERELLLLYLAAEASDVGVGAPDVRAAWAEECDRRYQDWQAGKVEAVPGDLVMQRVQERLAK
jgi:hypothetical protein